MKSRLVSIKRIIDKEVGYDISKKNRKRSHTYARAIYCKIAREMGGPRQNSLSDIGEVINRDHATVLHSLNVVFPFAIKESGFKMLYLTLKAIFVDQDQTEDEFDAVKSLSDKIVHLEKDNFELRQKVDLLRFGSSMFDKLIDGLSSDEIDEIYYKMEIFVKAVKSRVYL